MTAMIQGRIRVPHGGASLSVKAGVIALVVSSHLLLILLGSVQLHGNIVVPHELTVSLETSEQLPQSILLPPYKISTMPLPEPLAEPSPLAVASVPQEQPVSVAAVTPVLADAEPDYKAAYLHNTPPSYPLVARRMGLQGRVVLSVEVLAEGVCGQINIHQSSGHPMLDSAALQAVKTWRFMPARQAGSAVNKWFMIPIQFSLKDQAA